jgi:hypothetical protein
MQNALWHVVQNGWDQRALQYRIIRVKGDQRRLVRGTGSTVPFRPDTLMVRIPCHSQTSG